MIFDLIKSPYSNNNTILIPTNRSSIGSIELHDMLLDCFPYRRETYELYLWCFSLCCADGYDNAIEFQN